MTTEILIPVPIHKHTALEIALCRMVAYTEIGGVRFALVTEYEADHLLTDDDDDFRPEDYCPDGSARI